MEWNTNLQKNGMEMKWKSNGDRMDMDITYIHGIFGKVYFRLDIFFRLAIWGSSFLDRTLFGHIIFGQGKFEHSISGQGIIGNGILGHLIQHSG